MAMAEYDVTADQARHLTDQIRLAVEGTWQLIRQAYEGGAWRALGYANWDDYCVREFGASRLRLPREERQEVVASLRESGLSIRAISSATGLAKDTVQKQVSQSRTPDESNDNVVGLDGKRYSARRVEPSPDDQDDEEQVSDEELDAIVDTLADAGEELTEERIEEAVDEAIESRRLPVPKPDLGNGVSHPARYSDVLLPVFADLLRGYVNVLDPFAGTGKIHELNGVDHVTVGIELEPEWAALNDGTKQGSALDLPFEDELFDAICTSPTYGNRLADSYNSADPENRRSYHFDLGRELSDGNSGVMHWGPDYRAFHLLAWNEALRVLRPGGRFVLNIKDHIRDGRWQDVTGWHVAALQALGLTVDAVRPVITGHLRQGTNAGTRADAELVIAFNKGEE